MLNIESFGIKKIRKQYYASEFISDAMSELSLDYHISESDFLNKIIYEFYLNFKSMKEVREELENPNVVEVMVSWDELLGYTKNDKEVVNYQRLIISKAKNNKFNAKKIDILEYNRKSEEELTSSVSNKSLQEIFHIFRIQSKYKIRSITKR